MSQNKEALIDIIIAIKLIFKYTQGVDRDVLENNTEKQDAILRRIIIIGEATKRLSQDFRNDHPSIPWKEIAGMRDVITHDYNEVDIDEVWKVINEDLPKLLTYIQPLTVGEIKDI